MAQNTMAQNGMAQNGMAQNTMAQNGMAQNGMVNLLLIPSIAFNLISFLNQPLNNPFLSLIKSIFGIQ